MAGRTDVFTSNTFIFLASNTATIDLFTVAGGPVEMKQSGTTRRLEQSCRALIPMGAAGGTCTVAVKRHDGTTVTIQNVIYGTKLDICARKLLAASTYTGVLVLW